MKQLYITLATLLLLVSNGFAQTLIYGENFGATSGLFANPGSTWGITSSAPTCDVAQSSRGEHVRTIANGTKTLEMRNNISTLGYSSASIIWNQYRNPFKNSSFFTAPVEFYYSIDNGATRVRVNFTSNTTNGVWNKVNGGTPIALPADAMGKADIRFYWTVTYTNGGGDNAYYAIDDITVVGTPSAGLSVFDWNTRPQDENPFVVSSPSSTTPYTVDGTTLRFSGTLGTGVVHETAKVDGTLFQGPIKSFAFIQKGATPTVGSTIQISLNKAVEDLSFTIFDIDMVVDQFKDQIKIVGYYGSNEVKLLRNKVVVTSSSQFDMASSTFSATSANIDNATNGGDVKVAFAGVVDRVVITYTNSDANRTTASGQQGLSIYNISWRKDTSVTIMPVELTYFKGQVQQSAAKLLWGTASEKDNKQFEIERSLDGKVFERIGTVAGNGNSSTAKAYEFMDQHPVTGYNYYRLRQVDEDGKSTYSKPVALQFSAVNVTTLTANVYPTLAREEVTVKLPLGLDKVNINILDASGRTVSKYTGVATELKVPVQQLTAGMYFVSIENGSSRETHRFIKQ